jgi:hypothetical protein
LAVVQPVECVWSVLIDDDASLLCAIAYRINFLVGKFSPFLNPTPDKLERNFEEGTLTPTGILFSLLYEPDENHPCCPNVGAFPLFFFGYFMLGPLFGLCKAV